MIKKLSLILQNKKVKLGLIVTGVILFAVAIFFTVQQKQKPQVAVDTSIPREKIPKKVVDLIGDVEKQTSLPEDEIPNIATVSDTSRLSGQVFFAQAQNGDKVLIYSIAKKAFLYRPSTKKIINTAPIEISSKASDSAQISGTNPSTTPSAQNVLRIKY